MTIIKYHFLAVFVVFLLVQNAWAYTDNQLCEAIFKAEGGYTAKYLFGIRSVKYEDYNDAKQICLNTIRNNRKRYADYGRKKYITFLEFLQSRYCPTKGKLSKTEKKLNGNWFKNVKYFLEKERRK